MKLGTRIFLCYVAIFTIGCYYLIDHVLDDLRIRYLEGVEETLVDQANIMASLVGIEMENAKFDPKFLHKVFDEAYSRNFSAEIYKLTKNHVDLRIYVTDHIGRVLFDSKHIENEGSNFRNWRDVNLTLRGRYGARSTLGNPNDPFSSILYIAAPIYVHQALAGVLTVAKPTTNINIFLKSAKMQLAKVGVIAIASVLIFSLIIVIWLTGPVKRLTRYAHDVRNGKRVLLPRLDNSEIGEMGRAFEMMREALEGKKYVEKYVQTLTHEIKSPVSAIRGAAELLEEDMPDDQRLRFLTNIRNESSRIQDIIDRMLQLSALETKKYLQKKELLDFKSLVLNVIEAMNPAAFRKGVQIDFATNNTFLMVRGDGFWLSQAVTNLLKNALEFSPDHEKISLSANIENNNLIFSVKDNGPGIPDYAMNKIFNRFFSLRRPDSDNKSTGLGLNIVQEVATLHKGSIQLKNRLNKGVEALFIFSVGQKNKKLTNF